MLEDLFKQEQEILEAINSIDSDKEELTKKYEKDIKILDVDKNRKQYELQHFYQMNVITLFNKVVEVVQSNEKLEEIDILDRIHYRNNGRDYHHFFSILSPNYKEISMVPATYDSYCKWQFPPGKKNVTIEELIYDKNTRNEDIKELYYNLKRIIKNGNN